MDTSGPPNPGHQGHQVPAEDGSSPNSMDTDNDPGTSQNTGQPARLAIQPAVPLHGDGIDLQAGQQLGTGDMQLIRTERVNPMSDFGDTFHPTKDAIKDFFRKLREAGEVFDGAFVSADGVKFEVHR